ncbi:Trypsin [Metarhizium anisopliae]|nr:Trypsin [Metarhizium anisopliae]
MAGKVTTILVLALSAISTLAAMDKRIVGGDRAKLGEFPFMVSLEGPRMPLCGGILLNSDTVLTAAHCRHMTLVTAGAVNRTNGGGVEVKVASIKQHPDYRLNPTKVGQTGPDFAINDIAIIKLATPIQESKTIRYARLPEDGFDPAPNSTAIAIGWGVNWSDYRYSSAKPINELLKVSLDIHKREKCAELEIGAAGRDTIVCAGGNGTSTCVYDDGGPLIDPKTEQVVGITSWMIRDERHFKHCNNSPGVFTRVGSYVGWINENSATAGGNGLSR